MTKVYEIWNRFELLRPDNTRLIVACNECAALYLQPMYGCRVWLPDSRFRCQIHESQGELREKESIMPVDRSRYPESWEEISHYIRFVRAGGRCEGSPAYPDCRAQHGQPHPATGSIVILTTAHLGVDKPDGTAGDKHDKLDCREENLKAMCQRCHLTYDIKEHAANAARTRHHKRLKAGQLELIKL